jgi:signal transduction histidine kinase
MPEYSEGYELLKRALQISYSSSSLEEKIGHMIQAISEVFHSDRALFLKPDGIRENGWISHIAAEKKPLWVEEGSSFGDDRILPGEETFVCSSFAFIPIEDRSFFEGLLYIGYEKPWKFPDQDRGFLEFISKVMGETIRQDDSHRIREFSTLWELNKALLTTVNFERIIHLTLTAITFGDGLGFNRAMLFLVNKKEKVLEGALGVGPDSAEEAGRIWSALSRKKGGFSDFVTRLHETTSTPSHLNSVVQEIRIPLEQQCILSRTVLEGKPFNIRFPESREGWLQTRCEWGCHLSSEVGCYVGDQLGRDTMAYSFATVPLWGKGKVIGVIVVDNLYNRRPITDEDLRLLSLFANQAGLAIENSLLYRRLEEVHRELKETQTLLVHHEKIVALGELASTVAHEIKNPLVSIGGFARRLDRAIPAEDPEKRYTETIMKEAARLERTLDDILSYTREESTAFKPCDLRDILNESLSMASEETGDRIRIVKQFHEGLPKVTGDFQRLKHAFFNLFANACQAMQERGTLTIRMNPVSRNGSKYVRVEVEDTGKGIDPMDLHNIFNPFYSTRASGLALGLPMVHRIITSHRGQIEVDNRPGKGATFIVTLQAANQPVSPSIEKK